MTVPEGIAVSKAEYVRPTDNNDDNYFALGDEKIYDNWRLLLALQAAGTVES